MMEKFSFDVDTWSRMVFHFVRPVPVSFCDNLNATADTVGLPDSRRTVPGPLTARAQLVSDFLPARASLCFTPGPHGLGWVLRGRPWVGEDLGPQTHPWPQVPALLMQVAWIRLVSCSWGFQRWMCGNVMSHQAFGEFFAPMQKFKGKRKCGLVIRRKIYVLCFEKIILPFSILFFQLCGGTEKKLGWSLWFLQLTHFQASKNSLHGVSFFGHLIFE